VPAAARAPSPITFRRAPRRRPPSEPPRRTSPSTSGAPPGSARCTGWTRPEPGRSLADPRQRLCLTPPVRASPAILLLELLAPLDDTSSGVGASQYYSLLIEETHESPSSRAPRPISPGERRCHSTTSDELTDGCECVGVAAAVEAVESGGDGRGSTVRPVRLPPRQPRQPHHLSTSPSLRGWPAVAMMGATVRPRPHEVVCEEGKSERERERERELCSPAARGH
jgi:hypothetical protein